MKQKKTWLITGASKGFGLALVKQLLQKGYNVAATSRTIAQLESAAGPSAPGFLPLEMDITSEASVKEGVDKAVAHFGGIDVVVNNAGYGLIGSLEELSDAEVRGNFEVNVFGTLNIIRATMPHLRKQGSGFVFNISSIGGFYGDFPGWGIYCATKFAVHGLTESFAAEVKPFGVKVVDVAPGYFRTNFLSSGSILTPAAPIDAYKEVRDSQAAHQDGINGNQPGDPDKAAEVMIAVSESENPPLHLFLGEDAYGLAHKKIDAVKAQLEEWRHLATATSFS